MSNNIVNVKHKRLIRKVFIILVRENVLCFLYGILSLPLTSFYENLTTRCLLSQSFKIFLICLLLLDPCKKVLTDSESKFYF